MYKRQVQVGDAAVQGENHNGIGCKVQQGPQPSFGLAQFLLGAFAVRDILKGFNGSGDSAAVVQQGGGCKKKPFAVSADTGEKVFYFIGAFDQGGAAIFAGLVSGNDILGNPIDNQVCQGLAFLRIKCFPLIRGSHQHVG